MQVGAILFDLDDTLYPERSFVRSGFRAVARWASQRLGVNPGEVYSQLWALFQSGVRGNTFDRWLTDRRIPHLNLAAEMVSVYRGHVPRISCYADVRSSLITLHRQFPLGIVSDGLLIVQRKKWAALQLEDQFDTVVFSDQWGRRCWKPAHRPFLEAAARLDCAASQCVYVADNPAKDFLGPRQLSMRTVRLRRRDGLYCDQQAPSQEYLPDAEIQHLGQLRATLRQLQRV